MNLKDAIGKDIFIFENAQYTDEDFKNMPSEELETLKARINVKITNLSSFIKTKRYQESEERLNGKKFMLELHMKVVPYIKNILKQRNKAGHTIGDYFMFQAKLLLPADDYEMILENAKKNVKQGGAV